MHKRFSDGGVNFPLSSAEAGQELELVRVNGGRRINHRLAELGLTPGVRIKVLQDAGCALVLSVRNSRIALGRGMASMVEVSGQENKSVPHVRQGLGREGGHRIHGFRSHRK
ncbi:MAG: ferrous iron transport protein A [Anaerolineales bacterium]|nr:ferrous iron transport protein A [Anaerolineales bacterium]